MPLFIPHKTLIEVMWYGGMSIPDIDGVLVENRYNPLPPEVYAEIIDDVSTANWKEAHKINEEIYTHNNGQRQTLKLRSAYYGEGDFDAYYNPGSVFDIMTYVSGAHRTAKGFGSTKAMKIFTTSKLRQFVEIATMCGIPAESIRQYLAQLVPNYGIWATKPVLSYAKTFWDATRLTMHTNNLRACDIREYLNLDPDNHFYSPYLQFLDASEDDVLAYFGLADYNTVQRKNKSLHGKIGSKIMDYFDEKSRRIIPTDYIKLFVHLDQQIQDLESQDKGTEAYRNEIKRMFDRLEYLKDNYLTMDELNKMYIALDPSIEKDEPYVKEQQ
jgi:hypothetical protein